MQVKILFLSTMLLVFAPWLQASEVVILFTNDLHGRLEPRRILGGGRSGGAPALEEIVQEEKRKLGPKDDLVLFDSGDFLYGGANGDHFKGKPTVALMNQLGYTAVGLGNHEFDLGWKTLHLRALESKFPWIAANLYESFQIAPHGIQPSRLFVLPRSGLKLGVIGLTDSGATPTGPKSSLPGLRFAPPLEAVTRELFRLQGQGAQKVLVLSHLGATLERKLIASLPPGIDFFIGGHHPSGRIDETIHSTRYLQAASEGIEVGQIVLPVAPRYLKPSVRFLPWATRKTGISKLDPLLSQYQAPQSVLAVNPKRLNLKDTYQWVLSGMAKQASEYGLSVDLTLINRRALLTGLPQGKITERTLRQIAPFDNHLVLVEMKSSVLRKVLNEDADRIVSHFSPGKTLPRRGTVSVLMNDFLAAGGDHYPVFARSSKRTILQETVRDAMRFHLEQQKSSSP